MICVSVFRCSPVKKAWDSSVEGKCVNFRGAIIGNAVPNILSDAVILSLPMPLLVSLLVSLGMIEDLLQDFFCDDVRTWGSNSIMLTCVL